ncbi:MAG: D-alanyl-D-alanine endopeptidase [Rubrivivax sp.]|nr:D-alanyl-D-alanine endopeptidase [Rubrivivax sp.]
MFWNGARSGAALLGLTLALLLSAPTLADAASNTSNRTKATAAKASTKASTKAQPVRKTRKVAARKPVVVVPAKLSYGQIAGLHGTDDPLNLKSSVALVIDQDTDEVLFSKNSDAVLPIASITKLMTAMVVVQAGQSLDEMLTVTQEDVDTEKGSGSRLAVGTQLSRGEMLHLALMSSENRAANALGRHYPGGIKAFVSAMNAKAGLLGMHATRYVEPTGLSSDNQSSAHDLAMLVKAASDQPLIRELSTAQETAVAIGRRQLQFRNTNALVRDPSWSIGLQKTGYISEAGRCVVMQAQMAGRKLIMVLLDSAGRYSRIGDAERLRTFLSSAPAALTGAVQPR